jgi:hypothetical protein
MKTLQQQETEAILSIAEGMKAMQQTIANLESQLEEANKLLREKQIEINSLNDLLAAK